MPVTTRATIRTATCHSSRRCNGSSGVVAGTWMTEPMPLCTPSTRPADAIQPRSHRDDDVPERLGPCRSWVAVANTPG